MNGKKRYYLCAVKYEKLGLLVDLLVAVLKKCGDGLHDEKIIMFGE
jgi:hypothetical protein